MDGAKKKRIWNWVASIAAVCFAGWLGLVGYVGCHAPATGGLRPCSMAKMPMPAYFVLPFETLWMRARHGQLNVGDAAPDLVVKELEDHRPTDLATLWADRPVVLVFGAVNT